MTEPLLLKPTEAARALGIGRSKLYELLREGTIHSIRIGTCRRVPAAALEEFVLAAATKANTDVHPSEPGWELT